MHVFPFKYITDWIIILWPKILNQAQWCNECYTMTQFLKYKQIQFVAFQKMQNNNPFDRISMIHAVSANDTTSQGENLAGMDFWGQTVRRHMGVSLRIWLVMKRLQCSGTAQLTLSPSISLTHTHKIALAAAHVTHRASPVVLCSGSK